MTSQTVYEQDQFKLINNSTTSKGNIEKYTDGNLWLKLDSFGYESLAEVVSSRVVAALGIPTVEYRPCFLAVNEYDVKPACVSSNFVPKGCSSTNAGRVLEKYYGLSGSNALLNAMYKSTLPSDHLKFVIDGLQHVMLANKLLKGLATYVWIDSIIVNTDRHVYNMAMVRCDENWQFINFDYGASLLSDLDDFSMNMPIGRAISKAKAKPFSSDYNKQLKLLEPYLPNDYPKSVSLDVRDLFDYYDALHIKRCCDVLSRNLTIKGISLSIKSKQAMSQEEIYGLVKSDMVLRQIAANKFGCSIDSELLTIQMFYAAKDKIITSRDELISLFS